MSDFTITERTEPFTLDEVFDFIEDSSLSTVDVCELKSRFMDAVQEIRVKAIDEFADELKKHKFHSNERYENCVPVCHIDWIASRMKGGVKC